MLHPSSINPFLSTLSSSDSSVPHSTKTSFVYTIRRNTHGHRCSPENMLFTSTRMLPVRRGQSSCEGLPPLLGCLKVDCRTEGGIDWRLNGPERCSRGGRSLLCPRRGFCLAWPVKSAPWSLLVNRFAVLNIKKVNTDTSEPIDTLSPSAPDRKALLQKPK